MVDIIDMNGLRRCFEDLEERIDPAEEDRLAGSWLDFAGLRRHEAFFAPARRAQCPSRRPEEWPDVKINDCWDDAGMMVYHQIKACSDTLNRAGGELLSVRPNYGTGIIPSMYGASVLMLPREADTLPGAQSLPDR
ncbi:MAG: hypothetical protein LBR87_00450, partial [Synergistaceae bacterium]|nr:hypothetical protein [Synergistaceae bacterium]